jgi:hypothetical protein
MTATAYQRSPRTRIPAAESPPAVGQIPEGVGAAAATAAPRPTIVTWSESAPCTCPEHCERDHDDE